MCALYDFRFETFEKLEGDNETLIEFNLRLLGRQRLMNGTIKCHTDIDEDYEWRVRVYQHRNGDWKHLDLAIKNTTCPFINTYGKYWENSMVDSNLPRGNDACPLKKGEYYLRNVAMRSENWMRYVKQGLNKCHLTVSKNNVVYGGFIGVAVLTEISTWRSHMYRKTYNRVPERSVSI